MERKDRETFAKRTGPIELDSRSDFCFVAQSFQRKQSIGPLLRCADAGMAREVIIVGQKTWRRKGAVGGTSCVPYRQMHTPRDAIDYLKSNGMSIVAIQKNARSINLFDCVYPPKPAFVIKDEVYGVHQNFLDAADLVVELPMYGVIKYLNMAVVGAVVMYDYLQKKQESQIKSEGQSMEKVNRKNSSRKDSLHDINSDFRFVAQSFQKIHNIDTVFRCADMGIAREVITVGRRSWEEKSNVVDKYCVPYKHTRLPGDAIEYLKSNGMSIVVIEKNNYSVSLFDCNYPSKPAFVLGNEVYGVYPDFIDAADLIVEIPMYGSLGSLNVSVSGAIVMYDYLGKNRNAP
jgi:tRNA G18 (ribose-2'-O)-methylase SpoU